MYESWSIHLISNLAARQLQERSWRRMRLCQRKWPGPSRASVNSTVLVFRSSRQLTQFLIQHKWNTWPSSTQNKDQNEGIAVLYQDQRKVPHMMFFLCQGHQIVVQQQEEGRNLRFSRGFSKGRNLCECRDPVDHRLRLWQKNRRTRTPKSSSTNSFWPDLQGVLGQ